jgi:hypothetical protein
LLKAISRYWAAFRSIAEKYRPPAGEFSLTMGNDGDKNEGRQSRALFVPGYN